MSKTFEQVQLKRWPSGLSHEVAVLAIEPGELERRYGLVFEEGEDDLDVFQEAIVRMKSGRQLMFLRYQGHPKSGTDVHADIGDDPTDATDELLGALDLDRSALSWTRTAE